MTNERIDQFLNFLAVEKNASQNTLAAYRNDLLQFTSFMEQAFPGLRLRR